MKKLIRKLAKRELTLYNYSELSPEAQRNAIKNIQNSNTAINYWTSEMEYLNDMYIYEDWYPDTVSDFVATIQDDKPEVYWDSASYAWLHIGYFDKLIEGYEIASYYDFKNRYDSLNDLEKEYFDALGAEIDTKTYHVDGRVYGFEIEEDEEDKYTIEELQAAYDKAVDTLTKVMNDIVSAIKIINDDLTRYMDYFSSEKYWEDTLPENDNIKFYEDGSLYS